MQFLRRATKSEQKDGSNEDEQKKRKESKGSWRDSLFKTDHVTQVGQLPSNISKATALRMLHDHPFYFSCDPCFRAFQPRDPPTSTLEACNIPEDIKAKTAPDEKVYLYEVTDYLPNPVWDSNILNNEELVNYPEGLFLRIHSVMGTMIEGRFWIREVAGGDGDDEKGALELVYDADVTCNRAFMPIAKYNIEKQSPLYFKALEKGMLEEEEKMRVVVEATA